MRVAIVHEWLESYAGSERVLEQLLTCYPDADLFAVVDFMPESERGFLRGRTVQTSFIQRLPFARKLFRAFLPLMAIAVEQFDMSSYDLVISSSHAVAKGVITGPNQVHVSYVHSPMRYAWDLQAQYLRHANLEFGLRSAYTRWMLHQMRLWDVRTAHGVDLFLANSRYIRTRIRKVYRRESIVIHPPVDTESFVPGGQKSDEYLVVARFVPYKRVDLVAAAFARMPERRVLIVGDGSARNGVLKAAAGAPNIRFRSGLDKSELVDVMQSARALIFPAEEDFGITMVEALACGTPVIAYGRGGACDIVEDGYTGVLFKAQTAESIMVAVERFEGLEPSFTRARCAERARRFSVAHFRRQLQDAVDKALRNFTSLSGQYFEGEEVAEAGAMTRSGQDDRKSVAARATTDEQVPVGVN